jgi:uncharacterized protein YndB with AHSA1/START domain
MAKDDAERTPDAPVELRMTRHFSAPPDALFRAWTNSTAFAQWMGPPGVTARDVRIDLRVNGRYNLVMDGEDGNAYPLSGEYREIDPPKRLVFTFEWGHGDLEGLEMLVSIDFIAERGGTRMEFLQERIPTERARGHHEEGWTGTFERLEAFLAGPSR